MPGKPAAPVEIEWTSTGPMPLCRSRAGELYPARLLQTVPLVDALARRHEQAQAGRQIDQSGTPVDQSWYLVAYGLRVGEQWSASLFRLKKSSPDWLMQQGIIERRQQVAGQIVMLDCDLSDLFPKSDPRYTTWYRSPDLTVVEKLPWNDERWQIWHQEIVPHLLRECPWFGHLACWYSTANGWRAVCLLDRPVPVIGGYATIEDITRGLMIDLGRAGIAIDTGCADWTRLMRPPACFKGERRLWEDPFFTVRWNGVYELERRGEDQPPTALQAWPPESFPRLTGFHVSELRTHPNWSLMKRAYGIYESRVNPEAIATEGAWASHAAVNCGYMPDADAADALLQGADGKRSALIKSLLDRLQRKSKEDPQKSGADKREMIMRARRLYELLAEHKPILEQFAIARGKSGLHYGNLHATGEFCSFFRTDLDPTSGLTPQVVYALLVGSYLRAMAARRQADAASARDDETVRQEAWRAVEGAFAMQIRFREEERQEIIDAAQNSTAPTEHELDRATSKAIIADTFREWLQVDDMWLEQELEHHLIVQTDMGHSIMQIRHGEALLSDPIKNISNWVPPIRDAGHELIIYQEHDDKWEHPRIRGESSLMDCYGSTCGKLIQASRLIPRHKLTFLREGGHQKLCFVHRLPGAAEDIAPAYDADIDEYIRLVGGAHHDHLLDWLQGFTNIRYPLPALYIKGAPGIGKNMIIRALELLTSRKCSAPFTQALGGFQDHFADTFFITVDEDVSTADRFTRDVVGVLRRMIGGQYNIIDMKGVKGMRLEGEWRLFIAANNADVFQIKQDLTETDIEALNGRIFFLDAGANTAAIHELLHRSGGRYGNEHGAGTESGNWPMKIAQFIKWLEINRSIVHTDERFLIKAPPTEWHENLRVTSSGGLLVCRAIAIALRTIAQGRPVEGIYLEKSGTKKGIYIQSGPFEEFLERTYPGKVHRVPQLLSRLCGEQIRVRLGTGKGGAPKVRVLARPLDISAFMKALHNRGYETDFQELFGDELWEAYAPDRIREELAAEPLDLTPELGDPEAPPKKTPFGFGDRVIQMPLQQAVGAFPV